MARIRVQKRERREGGASHDLYRMPVLLFCHPFMHFHFRFSIEKRDNNDEDDDDKK